MTSVERIPWGSLPLELHVLSEWTSLAIDDLDQRRRQLEQQYIAVGYPGRYVSVRRICESPAFFFSRTATAAGRRSLCRPIRF